MNRFLEGKPEDLVRRYMAEVITTDDIVDRTAAGRIDAIATLIGLALDGGIHPSPLSWQHFVAELHDLAKAVKYLESREPYERGDA